jgi:uncharacterized lipoprotein YddW (UPF0748 family)
VKHIHDPHDNVKTQIKTASPLVPMLHSCFSGRLRNIAVAAVAVAVICLPSVAPAAEPFLGAYVEIPELFKGATSEAEREETMARQLDRFHDAGLRVVMPYVVTTSNVAYYPSRLIPIKACPDGDPLAILMRLARQRGLKVYPVICVMSSGGDRPRGILKEHPEWALRDKTGQPMGFISPGHPEARKYVVAMIKEVAANYKPDGVLLDYLRYYADETPLDAVSQAGFDRLHPADRFPPDGREYTGAMYAFKRQLLTELVGQISGELRALAPRPRIAIYMWHARERKYTRDWATWVGRGYIDQVNLRGYYYRKNEGDRYLEKLEENFRGVSEVLGELHKPVELTMCVGISTTYDTIRSAREIGDYLEVAKRCGVQGVAFFRWHSLLPFLDDVKKEGYIERFVSGLSSR